MTEHPLIAFLRARLDERERWARAAVSYSPNWHTEVAREDPYDESRACVRGGLGEVITDGIPARYADHIEENDPAYVLADVDSKRQILDDHGPETVRTGWSAEERVCRRCRYDEGLNTYPYGGCPAVLALAMPYAARDDYPKDLT